MSKALVIKGADFANNKLGTVTLLDPVPCTGVTLNNNSISATSIGATYTLVATVTPSDTTDSVVWLSSDENIATVNNGVVTTHRVGQATISARCGSIIATCTVSVILTLNLNEQYSFIDGYGATDTDLNVDPPKDMVRASAGAKFKLFYNSENTLDGIRAFSNYISILPFTATAYPIPLFGAKHVHISKPSTADAIQFKVLNSQEYTTYYSDSQKAAKCVYSLNTEGTHDLSEVTGADSFVLSVRASGSSSSEITDDVVVTLS